MRGKRATAAKVEETGCRGSMVGPPSRRKRTQHTMKQGGSSNRPTVPGDLPARSLAYERLSAPEKAVWRTVVGAMRPGWLSQAPTHVLALYCRRVCEAEALVQRAARVDPALFATPEGLRHFGRLIGQADRERRAMVACAQALGLSTPALNAVYQLLQSRRVASERAARRPAAIAKAS
jgi:hypothetical protein